MLFLFDKNRLIAPDSLKRHPSLYTEEIQVPLGIERTTADKVTGRQELAVPSSGWQTRNHPQRVRTVTGRNNSTSGLGSTLLPSSVGMPRNRSAIKNSQNFQNPHNTHPMSSNWNGGSGGGGSIGAANSHEWTSFDSGTPSNSGVASSSWRHKSYPWRNESEANSGASNSNSIAYDAGETGGVDNGVGGGGVNDRSDSGDKINSYVHSIGGGNAKWNKWRVNDSLSSLAKNETLSKKPSLTSACSSDHSLFTTGSIRSNWNTEDVKTTNGSLDDRKSLEQQNQNTESLASFSDNASSTVQAARPLPAADHLIPGLNSSTSLSSSSSSSSLSSTSTSVSSISSKTKLTTSCSASAQVAAQSLARPKDDSSEEAVHNELLLNLNLSSNGAVSESLLPMKTDVKPEAEQPFGAQNLPNYLLNYLDTANLSQNLNSIMNHAISLNQMASLSSLLQQQQQQQQQQQSQLHNNSLLTPLPRPPMMETKMPPPPPNLNILQSQTQNRYQVQTGLPISLAATMLPPPPPPSLPLPNSAASVSGALGSSSLSFSSIMDDKWYYLDPQGEVQGPFTTLEMNDWYRVGYFSLNLNVRRQNDTMFVPLQELVKMSPHLPFHVALHQSAQQQSQQKLFTTNPLMDTTAAASTTAAPASTSTSAETATSSSKAVSDSSMPANSGLPTFASDFLIDNQLKQLILEQKQRNDLIMLLHQQAMINAVAPGLTPSATAATHPLLPPLPPLLQSQPQPPLLSSLPPLPPLLFPPPPPPLSSLLNPKNLDPQSQQKHTSSIESTNFLLSLMKQPQQASSNQTMAPSLINDLSSSNFFNSTKQWRSSEENSMYFTNDFTLDSNNINDEKKDDEEEEEVKYATEDYSTPMYDFKKNKLYHDEIVPLPPNVIISKKDANIESKTATLSSTSVAIDDTGLKGMLKSLENVAAEENRDTKGKIPKSAISSAAKTPKKSQDKPEPNCQPKSMKKVKKKLTTVAQPQPQPQPQPQSQLQSPVTIAAPKPAPAPKTKLKPLTTVECKTEIAKMTIPSSLAQKRQSNEQDKNYLNKKLEPHEMSKTSTKEPRIWNEVDKIVLPLREIQKIEQKIEKKINSEKKSKASVPNGDHSNQKTETPVAGWAKTKVNVPMATTKSKLPTLIEIQAEQKKVQNKVKSSLAATLASQQNAPSTFLQEKKVAWTSNNVTSKSATTVGTATTKVATAWSGGFWDCESTKAAAAAVAMPPKQVAVVTTSKQNAKSKAAVSSPTDLEKDRLEFESWCVKVLMHAVGNDSKGVDIAELVKLIIDAESVSDTRDYVFNYFGQSKGIQHFLSQFSERKSKFREKHFGSQPKNVIKSSALSSINKQHVATTTTTNKTKKGKKKEMKKIEPSMLGIRAVAAEDRYNAGDLDFGDDDL